MNGLPNQRAQSTPGRSDPPVKPTSEVAHQPGQQLAAMNWCLAKNRQGTERGLICDRPVHDDPYHHDQVRGIWWSILMPADAQLVIRGPGSAVECSTERSRAPRDNGGACGGTRLGNPCDEDGLTR